MMNEQDQARLLRGANFLEHHGVKGMKWGVRKSTSSGGSAAKSVRSRVATASKSATTRAAGRAAAIAIVSVAGGLAVSSLGGPVAGAAAGAALRGALGVSTKSSDSSFDGGPGIKIRGESNGRYDITDSHGRDMTVDHNILQQLLDQS